MALEIVFEVSLFAVLLDDVCVVLVGYDFVEAYDIGVGEGLEEVDLLGGRGTSCIVLGSSILTRLAIKYWLFLSLTMEVSSVRTRGTFGMATNRLHYQVSLLEHLIYNTEPLNQAKSSAEPASQKQALLFAKTVASLGEAAL